MCAKPILEVEAGTWVRACRIEALADRAILPVRVAGLDLVLVQDGGRIFAAERACPHEGADLALGRCAAGRLFCPRHLAWFTLPGGAVSPGWSFRDLRTYPVRIEGSTIVVRIDGGL
jgi:3-phenylpropionate/trans-cinnamate dioxygenase ferredoxin subunit